MHPTHPHRALRAYGDREGDGMVQMSFVLQMPPSARAREAAKKFAELHGLREPLVSAMEECAEGFSYFVVYGHSTHAVDASKIEVPEIRTEALGREQIEHRIHTRLGRKIVVVGACTGFDAHTVGIDAIMNMKGYNHHYGLERYHEVEAHNLGAQVPNEKLIDFAVKVNADAILVSQIVTQKDVHIRNLTELIELLEARGLRERFVVCAGGSRISNKLAVELGYDAGFGQGTYAEHVATFLIEKLGAHPGVRS